jgi:hypothetical protein
MRSSFALLFALAPLAWADDDPREIVRRALGSNESVFDAVRDYTYIRHSVEKRLDKNGAVESTEAETEEVLVLYGRPYYRLVARNGANLSARDERKEQNQLDKELAKRKRDAERGSAEADKELEDRRRATREIFEAYHFDLVGVETLGGRSAWVIDASPRPGYKPTSREAKAFVKSSGRIWVDQEDTRLVKLDVRMNEPISFGWFIFRLRPGARLQLEQTRVEDRVWLPKRLWLRGEAKILGVKTIRVEAETSYRDYRKFQAESRVVATTAE